MDKREGGKLPDQGRRDAPTQNVGVNSKRESLPLHDLHSLEGCATVACQYRNKQAPALHARNGREVKGGAGRDGGRQR